MTNTEIHILKEFWPYFAAMPVTAMLGALFGHLLMKDITRAQRVAWHKSAQGCIIVMLVFFGATQIVLAAI